MISTSILQKGITNTGLDLHKLSKTRSVMLVFLRHFGCIFCQEAMYDIGKKRAEWESRGLVIVLVHMSEESVALPYFEKFGLSGVQHISDPNCGLYAAFGLSKGTPRQLFGLKTWVNGFKAMRKENVSYKLNTIGDGLQMPGVFLLVNGEIAESFIHNKIDEKPDYENMVSNCCSVN